MARVDALVIGKQEADAYDRSRETVIQATRQETFESPFQSTMDELYWCLRRLQAYEAWQLHGAWIKAKPRRFGPGIKERFEFGATVDRNIAHAEEVRRIAFRAELLEMLGKDGFLVLPTVPGAAPLKSAPQQEMQAYRERALRLLCLSGLSGFPQITLPIGEVHGAPFGISLLGPPNSDIALIRLGRRILEAARKG